MANALVRLLAQSVGHAERRNCSRVDASGYLNALLPLVHGNRLAGLWTEDAVGIFDTGSFDPKWKVYWETQVEGALAREISHNLLVRISGSLQAWPNGSMIVCGTDQSDPTVTTPIDRKRKICGFNGRPDHIEFLNAATGHLLFQIARKPSSATRSR